MRMEYQNEIEAPLRASDHPNVREYLRMRHASQAALDRVMGPTSAAAIEWAHSAVGVDSTAEAYKARGEEILEKLTEQSDYTDQLQVAHDAALLWAQTVAPEFNDSRLRAALYRQSVILRVMRSEHRPLAEVMIHIALGVLRQPMREG